MIAIPELLDGSRANDKHKKISASIVDHLRSLKCRESHYRRSKSVRSYLSPQLSVNKFWRLWKKDRINKNIPTVSYRKYFNIFTSKFHLGFGSPRTDKRSFCEKSKVEIAAAENSSKKKPNRPNSIQIAQTPV